MLPLNRRANAKSVARLRRAVAVSVAVLVAGGLVAWAAAGGGSLKLDAATAGTTPTTAGATTTTGTTPTTTRPGQPTGPNCSQTSVGFTPLTELATGRYKGYEGGLYPGGRNSPSRHYLDGGLAAAARVRPLDPNGVPSRSGRIVLLSIGMSNTYLEFLHFMELAGTQFVRAGDLVVASPATGNPRLELVNGATPSWDAGMIVNNEAGYLGIVNSDLADGGVTADQVQAVWLDEAIQNEHQPFPADSQTLRADIDTIIAMLTARFPNLRLVYMSSREYAGYSVSTINPEPYAYESGFAVKWEVARRTAHPLQRPWVAWGPYTWADGTTPRPDGLTWTCADFQRDGTHPSSSGADKVGNLLLKFFTSNRTTRTWFGG